MRLLTLAKAAFGLMLATAPAAADEALRALVTGDQGRGWEAVGRVDLGNEAFCTGALIAPDLVLTAAHCLFSSRSGAMIGTDQISFLAGWRNGSAIAYRGARRAVVPAGYRYGDSDRIDRIEGDIALIELDQPIRLPTVMPFAMAALPRAGTDVGVVSYARDREGVPSLQSLCQVLERAGEVLMLSCEADFGASGAPVFVLRGGVPSIVSVVSAMADAEGRKVSLAVSVAGVAALRAVLDADRGSTGSAGSGGQMAATTGAKFVRP
ncbi:trypsin-like serine peptidase [Phaeovulum sp.]|uniref:trypsin-like serine peptidase n=1 Tax=Phaeovulum sp. TaxID=2934796 RepID=UPI00272F1869|nr:trypsin-like peptidase domain-containing protein [Phaeovulum sp.]MDP1667521.1 trypsin-like serine protease [Phaeovulum sp.]MDZ4120038.1 trypsin-like serine protease [Phaeovulum sp.]